MSNSLNNIFAMTVPHGTRNILGNIVQRMKEGSLPSLTTAHQQVIEPLLARLEPPHSRTLRLLRPMWGLFARSLVVYAETPHSQNPSPLQFQALELGRQIYTRIRKKDPRRSPNLRNLFEHPAYSLAFIKHFGDILPHDSAASIRGNSKNVGFFATKTFSAGEVITPAKGNTITFVQTLFKRARESDALQIGPDLYIDLEEPARSINHSCNPNAKITPELTIVARRQIRAGHAITFDYSTTMDEGEHGWSMRCGCRSKACRGTIKDFSTLPAELQQQYRKERAVPQFLLKEE